MFTIYNIIGFCALIIFFAILIVLAIATIRAPSQADDQPPGEYQNSGWLRRRRWQRIINAAKKRQREKEFMELYDSRKSQQTTNRRKQKPNLDLAVLAKRLHLTVEQLENFKSNYRLRHVPKKSGGVRVLSVPDKDTADMQRRVLHLLLAKLKAHPAATGFERGLSVVDNALPHAARKVVVRMDIVDFFPTTNAARVRRFFKMLGWDEHAIAALVRITVHEGGLPQGAPTSPRLSNLVNITLDAKLTGIATQYGGVYTRYADDITFSFDEDRPDKMRGLVQVTQRILKTYGYQMHTRKKLNIRRAHERHLITGLVVNDGVRLPRETRRWLRAVKHRRAQGHTISMTDQQFAGWLAYEKMVHTQGGRDAAT